MTHIKAYHGLRDGNEFFVVDDGEHIYEGETYARPMTLNNFCDLLRKLASDETDIKYYDDIRETAN